MQSTRSYGRKHLMRKKVVVLACVVGAVAYALPRTAQADTPASTDFGQAELTSSAVQTTFVAEPSHAMFLTVYGDGRHAMEVLPVSGDAVNAFAGAHPTWRLDSRMTWLVRMPVYVRELNAKTAHTGQASI